ncbi:sensor domain-containing diguanylate cyclase [Sphingomonas sp. RP10(2022)]|uniref:Sensor domain-containing diguanylate cyclase n=1 Tax=Sphingomonas liriopis TaxID=2949094 RepID=A0A9X2HTQ9_9SPHN|nr:diguanylate cyclase [Sphingomonas liriopis]MCP3735712.1 sensor domain-containing diguanylate cyclase [Sphingomonas liriopis]
MSDAACFSDLRYDETGRLAALHALDMLDSDPEREFDALVALAAQMLGCPVALITMIDRERLWIKATTMPGERNVDRDIAICDWTIRQDVPMIVDDLAQDDRFRDNPLVVDHGNRFYAGTAIHVADGDGIRQPIGTLCVLDDSPRSLNAAGEAALRHLASLAEALIAARRTALEALRIAKTGEELVGRLARNDRIFRQAERIAMIGSWRLSVADSTLDWSENVFRIHDLPVGAIPALANALDFYPPHARAIVSDVLARTMATGEPFDFETDFITADGRQRRVRSAGEAEMANGVVTALVGVFQDLTERHQLEVQLRRSADIDALTGIANRAAFDRELDAAMDAARRDGSPLMLALIDLDGFKGINDSLGHDAGDDVLRLTGLALTQPWLRDCFAARIGGDEFAIVVTDPQLIAHAAQFRLDIEAALRVSVEAGGITMTSGGSVGTAAFDADCHSLRDFARRADAMLYAAKRARVGGRRALPRRAA